MNHAARSRPPLAICLLILLVAATCPAQPDPTHFRFDWPVPSRAVVEMMGEESDQSMKARFTLSLEQGATEDELTVLLRDFEFLAFGDADLDDPAVRAELAPILAVTGAIPPLVISRQGHFLRIDEWDRMVEDVLAFIKQNHPGWQDENDAHFTSLLSDPATRQQMQQNSARDWDLWVGNWIDVTLMRGESTQFGYPMSLPWGGMFEGVARLAYQEADPERPDEHRLSLEIMCSGAEFREALINNLIGIMPPEERTDEEIAELQAEIGNCLIAYTAEAVTDPATLMPTLITSSKTITIDGRNGERDQQTERRRYEFSWE